MRYTMDMNVEELELQQQRRNFCWSANLYDTKVKD